MKRKHKRILVRAVVLALFFIAASVAAFLFSRQPREDNKTVINMSDPTLPLVSAQVEGTYVNLMHGYVNEMVGRYMRDAVTPLPKDRKLKLRITESGDRVESLSYEIRSMDTTRLIENTSVDSLKRSDNGDGSFYVSVTLPIQNLLDEDTEYLLVLKLKTEAHDEVCYYTRIVNSSSYPVEKMLSFAESFHYKTLDTSKNGGVAVYMKTTTDTKKNLGHVTLNSVYSEVIWEKMKPEMVSDLQMKIMDIGSSIGTFEMESRVSFTDNGGSVHVCDVTETITLQYTNRTWYVLNYERNANEVLSESVAREGKNQMTLGIVNDADLSVVTSENGLCQAFIYNGCLYLNKAEENGTAELISLFAFSGGNDDLRGKYNAHGLKVVSLEDSGKCSFILYGYMNSGNHEGEVGLTFYEYSPEDGMLDERFYLPFDRSAEMLIREMGRLSYINDSELFYLMLGDRIYAIDFEGREYMTIVEDISDDALAINEMSNVVAWEEDRSESGAGRIVILYLDDGHQNVVEASEGEKLHVLGFVGEDCAVGHIRETDYEKFSAQTQYPMYRMDIVDSNGSIAGSYEKNHIMITSAEVENDSIIIRRSKVSGSTLTAATDDALIGINSEIAGTQELTTTSKSDNGYLITYLNVYAVSADPEPVSVSKLAVSDSSYLRITLSDTGTDDQYYAWSKGKLQAICMTVKDAVDAVYDDVGYVTDCNGNYVLRRGFRGYANLTLSTVAKAKDAKESMKIAMQAFSSFEGGSFGESFENLQAEGLSKAELLQRGVNGTVYDLTGCSLTQIVYYYLKHGHLIYGEMNGKSVLITGINGDNLSIWNPLTGQIETMNLTAAEKTFENSGNVFISCMD